MLRTVGYTDSEKYKCLENLQKGAVDICLTYCGWENCNPGHRYGPNKRVSNVLHIVESGAGVLEIGGTRYTLEAGDAFLIHSEVEAWYQADQENPWTYRWIGFEGMSADEITASAGFTAKRPVRRVGCLKEVSGYIDGMLSTSQLLYENELKRNALLMLLFSDLQADYRKICLSEGRVPPSYRYPGSAYVEQAVEYITVNFDKKLKINELADQIGVNRSYLTSSFKRNLGCSPQEYLMNIRLEKAKSLLKKGNLPINEVAVKVGYADPLAFSKMFKMKTGRSPKEYKEEKHELVKCKKKHEYIEAEI